MKIKLFGTLKTFTGGRELIEIKLDSEKRISDIFASLNIPESHVFLIEKSGKSLQKDSMVSDNDEISLVPILEGGESPAS